MTGEILHEFDIQLCRHVFDNVGTHMGDPKFAAFVEEWMEAAVLAYMKALDGDEEPAPLLLSVAELEELWVGFGGEEFQFDRDWVVYKALYRRSIDCFAEIRNALAKPYAEEWADLCAQFAERLEARNVCLHHGIEIVQEWVGELRRLLRAMGATHLLPAPEGTFPTPTNPEPPALPPADATTATNSPGNDDALTTALGKTQALQEEIRDILLSQCRVQEFYSPAEAAAFLGKAEFTVREWCRLGRVNAEKRRSGRGRSLEWVISHAELLRIQKEGLLPQPRTSTRLR